MVLDSLEKSRHVLSDIAVNSLVHVRSDMRASSSMTALDSLENTYAAPLDEPIAPPPNEAQLRARARAEARASKHARHGPLPPGIPQRNSHATEVDQAPLTMPVTPLVVAAAKAAATANSTGGGGPRRARFAAGLGPGSGLGLDAAPSGRLSLDGAMARVSEEELLSNDAPCAGRGLGLHNANGAAPAQEEPALPDGNAGQSKAEHAGRGPCASANDNGVYLGNGDAAADASAHIETPLEAGQASMAGGKLRAVPEETAFAAAAAETEKGPGAPGASGSPSVPEAANSAPAELIPAASEVGIPEGGGKRARHQYHALALVWVQAWVHEYSGL